MSSRPKISRSSGTTLGVYARNRRNSIIREGRRHHTVHQVARSADDSSIGTPRTRRGSTGSNTEPFPTINEEFLTASMSPVSAAATTDVSANANTSTNLCDNPNCTNGQCAVCETIKANDIFYGSGMSYDGDITQHDSLRDSVSMTDPIFDTYSDGSTDSIDGSTADNNGPSDLLFNHTPSTDDIKYDSISFKRKGRVVYRMRVPAGSNPANAQPWLWSRGIAALHQPPTGV